MDRLTKILDTEPEIRDTPATETSIPSIDGSIEFRDVIFRHKDADRPALDGINLSIPAGTTLAIVGYTGSGKSTLVNLIPRLYDVTEGELLIDGVDVRKIPLEVLRSSIGYVPQETFLFSDSIADNISYGARIRPKRRSRVLQKYRKSPRILRDFPRGYETVLGERGITLSGGQKQRTSIARAVMREPKILILDDALSAVDTYTEEEILKRLRRVMKGRTSIIISHGSPP